MQRISHENNIEETVLSLTMQHCCVLGFPDGMSKIDLRTALTSISYLSPFLKFSKLARHC